MLSAVQRGWRRVCNVCWRSRARCIHGKCMTNTIHPWRQDARNKFGSRADSSNSAVLPVARLSNPPEVETTLLRKAFEQSGMTKCELAWRMGFVRANIDQLNRALGYRPDSDSRCKPRTKPRKRMSYDLATRLCEAMNASPFDCGI